MILGVTLSCQGYGVAPRRRPGGVQSGWDRLKMAGMGSFQNDTAAQHGAKAPDEQERAQGMWSLRVWGLAGRQAARGVTVTRD